MKGKLIFLTSTRFWKMVIIGVLVALQGEGVISGGLLEAITVIVEIALGGSVAIRTIDRFAEKVGAPK